MSETTAEKRKEPEPEAKVEATNVATPAPDAESQQPDPKRLKPNPPDAAVVRKQIEYYLSDENLKYDKFFHEKIATNGEGWLDLSLILSCNKMKAMRASNDDVLKALQGSKIEVNTDGTAVRRPGNVALPSLESKPAHVKKSGIHAHDGGVVAIIKNLPEKHPWTEVKDKIKGKLPEKVSLWYVGEVVDRKCVVACSPFDGDVSLFEELELEVAGSAAKSEVAQGEQLQAALKQLPKHLKEKREKEARKRQKERNRPIVIGSTRFQHVAALRGRVKEILNSRNDGEQLKVGGSDFKLIKALLSYHPKGDEKSKKMVGIKVGKYQGGDSRCFYMINEDGTEEDFSAKKCLDAIDINPPYVPATTKEEKKTGDGAAKDSSSSQAAAPESTEAAAADDSTMAEDGGREEAAEKEEGDAKVDAA
mmetsp:Transcript_52202/g.122117  ORF Transcript_52202/g.122117 Transcript_52202/m.122117 type:complete len:420 (-) Transcript_52202:58-1317(-)